MKIVVAVDDSPHSDRAVEFVSRMRWPGGSRIIVASVLSPRAKAMAVSVIPAMNYAPSDLEVVHNEQLRHHQQAVDRAADVLRQAGLCTEGRVLEGDPRECLLDLATQERADLLVLGSHGRTGLARLVLGSVSSHAVTHADCSVLVVKAPAKKPTRKVTP